MPQLLRAPDNRHAPLVELEREGFTVIPTARAAQLTMDREGIRRLAAETLGLRTSPYRFASSLEELQAGAAAVGFPCVVKPVMSSSGKGQSKVDSAADVQAAWDYAAAGSRVAVTMTFSDWAKAGPKSDKRHSAAMPAPVTSFITQHAG